MSAPPVRRYLTTGDVAQRFEVHPRTPLRWIENGLLPAFRTPGGQWRVDVADLEALAAKLGLK